MGGWSRMFDPKLSTGEMAAAKSVYALVLALVVIAIWRVVQALDHPTSLKIVIALVCVIVALATSFVALRAWKSFSLGE